MKSIRTDLSVADIRLLEVFLKANDLETIKIGHYEERQNNYQIDNKICYLYDENDESVTSTLLYLALKYGSLEIAFKDFKEKVKKYSGYPTF